MADKFKYSGDLNKRLKPPQIGLLASDEEVTESLSQFRKERYRRMVLLFDAHQIPHGDWAGLCFALAETHVPGFKVAIEQRRPLEWDDHLLADLYLAVDDIQSGNISEAIRQLSITEHWGGMFGPMTAAERLAERYKQAKNSMSAQRLVALKKTIREGERWCAENGFSIAEYCKENGIFWE